MIYMNYLQPPQNLTKLKIEGTSSRQIQYKLFNFQSFSKKQRRQPTLTNFSLVKDISTLENFVSFVANSEDRIAMWQECLPTPNHQRKRRFSLYGIFQTSGVYVLLQCKRILPV